MFSRSIFEKIKITMEKNREFSNNSQRIDNNRLKNDGVILQNNLILKCQTIHIVMMIVAVVQRCCRRRFSASNTHTKKKKCVYVVGSVCMLELIPKYLTFAFVTRFFFVSMPVSFSFSLLFLLLCICHRYCRKSHSTFDIPCSCHMFITETRAEFFLKF